MYGGPERSRATWPYLLFPLPRPPPLDFWTGVLPLSSPREERPADSELSSARGTSAPEAVVDVAAESELLAAGLSLNLFLNLFFLKGCFLSCKPLDSSFMRARCSTTSLHRRRSASESRDSVFCVAYREDADAFINFVRRKSMLRCAKRRCGRRKRKL